MERGEVGREGIPADAVRWAAWTPDEAQERLGSADLPWCVAGGWAIDLFVGHRTREHGDLEIAVPRSRWAELAARLGDLRFLVADDGRLWPLDGVNLARSFQVWGFDDQGIARLEVFREQHEADTWICRRHEAVRRPYADTTEVGVTGVPYLAPEIALLFKAKHSREKDRRDLQVALPLMDDVRRSWLRAALELVHPGHPWLQVVTASGRGPERLRDDAERGQAL